MHPQYRVVLLPMHPIFAYEKSRKSPIRFDHSKEVPAWNKEDHFSERGRRRPVVKGRAASRRVLSRRPRPSCLPASLAGPLTRSSLVGAVPRHLSPFDIFLACFQYFNQEESLPSPFLIIRDRVLTDKDIVDIVACCVFFAQLVTVGTREVGGNCNLP